VAFRFQEDVGLLWLVAMDEVTGSNFRHFSHTVS
jgi:hypothetical protein